jgi:hypothetical protein
MTTPGVNMDALNRWAVVVNNGADYREALEILRNGLRRCLPWRSERAIHRDAYALFRNTAAFTSAGLMSLRSIPSPGSRSVAN